MLKRLRSWTWKRWLVVALIAFPIFTVTSVEVTSQSWFCNSCHIMGPYYDSWRVGTHKDVDCVQCHISPGVTNFLAAKFNGLGQVVDDVLHRTSTKPSASVSELACMRSGCHTVDQIREAEKKKGNQAGGPAHGSAPFKFVHDKHLNQETAGVKIACGTCHSHVQGSSHFEVNSNVCITCHLIERDKESANGTNGHAPSILRMALRETRVRAQDAAPNGSNGHKAAPPGSCITCHDAPAEVIEVGELRVDHAQYLSYGASCESCHRGATATPEPIEDGRCLQCHTFGVEKATSAEEMHKVHSEGHHKVECFSCHGSVRHGPTAQVGSIGELDCRRCHLGQHAVQRETYLSEHGPMPEAPRDGVLSPMFLAHVDCSGCHVKERTLHAKPNSPARVTAAAAEACDGCHKPGLGEQMIPLWQKTTRALCEEVEAELKAAEAGETRVATPEAIEEARRILNLVRVDGSWGVHNPKYTQQLLESARDRLRGVKPSKDEENPP